MTEDNRYVIDNQNIVWLVVRDGGMVTRAKYDGVQSAGIQWLENNFGPLATFTGKRLRELLLDDPS